MINMERISFAENWNNKLNCKFFHTIRKGNNYDYYRKQVHKKFEIYVEGFKKTEADLLSARLIKYDDLLYEMLVMDTGYEKPDELFQKFNPLNESREVTLLLFKIC